MSEIICDKKICTKKLELMSSDDNKAILQVSDNDGRYTMTVYQVFPGIQLIYSDAHTQSVNIDDRETASDSVFEISHCREGRLEYETEGKFCHLSPGDIAITKTNCVSSASYFPLGHFHGVSIRIDLGQTPQCLSCLLEDVTVQPQQIIKKFCGENTSFAERANPSLENLFSQLYFVRSDIEKGYFKIKILELFMLLSTMDPSKKTKSEKTITKSQATLAKQISDYLMQHMHQRVTLENLSERFHVSGTHIKNIFKDVYGVSPHTFIRTQKMESAAYMLEYTEKSVLEIAGEHGYDNGSKFAGAFREIKGMSPNEYRNLNYKI